MRNFVSFVSLVVILLSVSSNGQSDGMSAIGSAYQAHSPCKEGVLFMSREVGGPKKPENYWDGVVDVARWPNIPEIYIELTVDSAARLSIDPDSGHATTRGRTFRIYAYGTPPGVNQVRFKVVGEITAPVPEVVSLKLNNAVICTDIRRVWHSIFHFCDLH